MKLNSVPSDNTLNKLIFKNLPENYENYDYIEPIYSNSNFIFNKLKNKKLEIFNDKDNSLINLLKVIRDKDKELIKKIKKIKYNEIIFEKEKNKEKLEEPIDLAVKEIVLLLMSISNNKIKFSNKKNLKEWSSVVEEIKEFSKKIQNIIILKEDPIKIINAFNYENFLCILNTELINSEDHDEHIKFGKAINAFKGKVIVNGYNNQLNRRIYKEWNSFKYSSAVDNKNKQLWKNF